jgi:O-antigen/teichoic acid export membrane protein
VALLAPLVVEPLLTALLGASFLGAGPPLLVLRWVLPAYVLSGVAGVVLRAGGHDRPLALVALLGAAVSLALNLLLIPAMGALGAAVSTLTAEVAMAGLALLLLRPSGLPLLRPVLFGGLTGAAAGGAGLLVATLVAGPWWLTAALAGIIGAGLLGLAAGGAWALGRRRWPTVEPGA